MIEKGRRKQMSSKFKIGDRVKCIKGGSKGSGWKLDLVFTVVNITLSSSNIYWNGFRNCGVYENSLELEKPRLNVSDKIRITIPRNNADWRFDGKEGIISTILPEQDNKYGIKIVGEDLIIFLAEEWIEKI